ncbi:pleckstrin homology domain-containing family A member 4 [Strigops habroptila]|uniref:pleckstrin homology domain-containing family A member 4 n=1 Tax=Strigops habroptila TaxID=2489341 RepID=UPI0011CF0001|nr:pleckstrin homology domain-containing family A member 4 [Strigops habroptila]
MAGGDDPPRRAPHPAGAGSPGTQPCRAVPRVHAFGKGGQALRRDPRTPPAMRGWLRKQDSSGLRLWKRRWFVLVDLCLYYYRDSSEQQVRGGLPLPGYEIRVLPPAPRTPHAPQFLFTAEHPGMRTYCLGAETPEELNAWVCALRRGASPLPRSPQEPRGAGPPSPPLPARCSPGEELGCPPMPPPRCTSGSPLTPSEVPPGQEEAPGAGGRPMAAPHDGSRPLCGAPERAGSPGHAPQPCPALTTPPRGISQREPRPPGAATNQQPPPPAASGRDAAEQDTAVNQTPASPTNSSDWLLPLPGTASQPAANETSPWAQEGMSGRGSQREGVAGRWARRPIRITLLQTSF